MAKASKAETRVPLHGRFTVGGTVEIVGEWEAVQRLLQLSGTLSGPIVPEEKAARMRADTLCILSLSTDADYWEFFAVEVGVWLLKDNHPAGIVNALPLVPGANGLFSVMGRNADSTATDLIVF